MSPPQQLSMPTQDDSDLQLLSDVTSEHLAEVYSMDQLADELRSLREQYDESKDNLMAKRYAEAPVRVNIEAILGLHAGIKLMHERHAIDGATAFVLRNLAQLMADSLAYMSGTSIEEIQADITKLQESFDYQQHLALGTRIEAMQTALQIKLSTNFGGSSSLADDDSPAATFQVDRDGNVEVTADSRDADDDDDEDVIDLAEARRQAALQEVIDEEEAKKANQRVIHFTNDASEQEEEGHNEEE